MKNLVGVLGSGWIGRDPFDRRAWSTSSYHFFTALRECGRLHRAFGVEAPRLVRGFLLAKNFRPNRQAWQHRFYLDPAYRRALTVEIARRIEPGDYDHDFLQLGSMYDVPSILQHRTRCFSYHDGNLAESLRSPNFPKGVGTRRIDAALAYEKTVAHGVDVTFTMSEYLRQSFLRDYGVPGERVVSVGAGINLDNVPDVRNDKDFATQEILFIGVDFARKGGWDLLRAFQGVRGRFPRATLHIVGPKELTLPSDQKAGVEYHGYVSRSAPEGKAKLDALFHRCSLFVMPSLYEPFGIAPIEAMVYRLPCVVTNRWALKEMVTPGVNGDLVECGQADDIEAKLSGLLGSPDRLKAMGDAGRERALGYYTWPKVVERMIAAIPQTPTSG